jgi:hypothetical protein
MELGEVLTCDVAEAGDAFGSSDVAADVGRADAGHRAVAWWQTHAGSGLVDTVDPQFLPRSVSRGSGQEAEESDNTLHCYGGSERRCRKDVQ